LDINSLFDIASSGNRGATEQLFEGLSARFRLFTRQRIWNGQDAEEVVQEALMTIHKEYRDIDFETSFAAWAYKVLDNRILAYIQTRKRQAGRTQPMTDQCDIPGAHSHNPNPDLKRKLLGCLDKMGDANVRYARVLNLHYHGFGTNEICGKLELTRTNFYSLLSRARSMLELCLDTGRIS
jgi:RNA polymerase sigma factor (sigma-70 family)